MTLTLSLTNIHSPNDKYDPAYEGAKFDKSGYCLKHPMIRLCKPANSNGSSSTSLLNPDTSENPRYVIVRKTCPMCGEHSLRNERKFNKQGWSHGYHQPERIERPSSKGFVTAESKQVLRRMSTVSTECESPPSSPSPECRRLVTPNSTLSSGRRSKNLEDIFANNGKKVPPPPIRDNSKNVPLPPVRDSSRARDSSRTRGRDPSVESTRKPRDVSAPRARLVGKVPYGDPKIRRREDFAASASSLLDRPRKREDFTASASSLLDRCESRSRAESRGRTKKEDLMTSAPSLLESKPKSKERSSSRSSRLSRSLAVVDGSSKSVAPRISRRHSTQVPSSTKSVCNASFRRLDAAATTQQPPKSIYRNKGFDESNRSLTTMKRSNSKHTLTDGTASMSSSEDDVPRGRSRVPAPQSRGRSRSSSKSKIERHIENSFFSRGRSASKSREDKSLFSRDRSKSKSREEEERTIFSAGRSFASSLSRRSLSRRASRVLKTTSTMDGNRDAEPCMQRYEVPFNPATGGCVYHPEVRLAVRNGGRRGGWQIVSEGCLKCEGR